MSYQLIVFDWDGTLLNSTGIIGQCIRQACQDANLPDPGATIANYVIGLGLNEALQHAAPSATPSQIQTLIQAYRHHYARQDHTMQLFEGAVPLLQTLHQHGVLCAVATGKSRAGLNHAMQQTNTAHYFASTRCADECHSKPHPQMLLELMDELAVEPQRVLMIGDTTHDLHMAAAAKVDAVAVQSGAHPPDLLQQAPHIQRFGSVNDMLPWLVQTLALER